MAKKNTLLYLDRRLVGDAKKSGVNLSELMDEALRRKLGPRGPFDPARYLQELNPPFVPFTIKSVRVEGVGPLQKAAFTFGKVTVVLGGNASGKTSLLRSLHGFTLLNGAAYPEPDAQVGRFVVDVEHSERLQLKQGSIQSPGCVLLDDVLDMLDEDQPQKLLSYLVKGKHQAILTCRRLPTKMPPNITIIKL
jgi:hypothetical protein